MPDRPVSQRDPDLVRYPIWICDHCGDLAECEPGEECEVCCEGTIQVVQCVPASELARLKAALEQLCDRVERDRREPDKLLCNVLSARAALRLVERELDV